MGSLIPALSFCLHVKRCIGFGTGVPPTPLCHLTCKLTHHEKIGSKMLSDPTHTHTHSTLTPRQFSAGGSLCLHHSPFLWMPTTSPSHSCHYCLFPPEPVSYRRTSVFTWPSMWPGTQEGCGRARPQSRAGSCPRKGLEPRTSKKDFVNDFGF